MYILKYRIDKYEFDGSIIIATEKEPKGFTRTKYCSTFNGKFKGYRNIGWDTHENLKELTRVFV